jgi:hypothetical protein
MASTLYSGLEQVQEWNYSLACLHDKFVHAEDRDMKNERRKFHTRASYSSARSYFMRLDGVPCVPINHSLYFYILPLSGLLVLTCIRRSSIKLCNINYITPKLHY